MTTRAMGRQIPAAALTVLFAAACAPAPTPVCLPPAGALAWPGLRSVVAALDDGAVRVRGFTGAVPAGAEVTVALPDGEPEAETADLRGRFDISISFNPGGTPPDAVLLAVPASDLSASVRVRSLDDALGCVAGQTRDVGMTPNDLAIGRCGEALLAFVPASTDGALEPALLSGTRLPPALAFPVEDGIRGPLPFAVALQADGELGAVTLFGQDSVALVDVCAGAVLDHGRALADGAHPLVVDVSPPRELSAPLDADGDGDRESRVSRMSARHPEGVAFVDGRLLVTFTNLLETGPPAVFGPGLVVAFDVEDGRLHSAGHTILPFQNPQAITLDDEGQPWVSCSGVLEQSDGRWRARSQGGLIRLDADSLEIVEVLALERFAPGTPAVTADWVIVGSVLEGSIALLPRGATALADGSVLETGASGVESLFEAVSLGGGLALVTEYATDALHVIDVDEGELHPWPFSRPIAVGPGGAVFRGLKAIARTPAPALTPGAPEAAALLSQSSEVVPLHLWQVLGP